MPTEAERRAQAWHVEQVEADPSHEQSSCWCCCISCPPDGDDPNPHWPADRPYVRIDPAQRFGQPAVRGVSAEVVAGMVWAGETVDVVADEFGLSRPEVLVACWWAGLYGTRVWRRRFGSWARAVGGSLWRREYGVPDPPAGQADTPGGGRVDDAVGG